MAAALPTVIVIICTIDMLCQCPYALVSSIATIIIAYIYMENNSNVTNL